MCYFKKTIKEKTFLNKNNCLKYKKIYFKLFINKN